MNTDQFAYELFVADPGSYFEMIGEPRSEANQYVFQAVDFKAIERRVDGYFEPREKGRPLHFVEVLFYKKENVYATLFAKVFLKLEQVPERDWRAAIIFESASLLPRIEALYQELLVGNRVRRIFLETLPEGPKSGLGLAIFKLVTKPKAEVLRDANLLVKRLKVEVLKKPKRTKLLDLIEFVVISRVSELSKEEVRTMLELDDYRQSKFYQEARQDGVEEGIQQGIEKGIEKGIEQGIEKGIQQGKEQLLKELILRMASNGRDAKQISDELGIELKVIRKILKSQSS